MSRNDETYTGPRDSWEVIWEVIENHIATLKHINNEQSLYEAEQLQKAYDSITQTEVR